MKNKTEESTAKSCCAKLPGETGQTFSREFSLPIVVVVVEMQRGIALEHLPNPISRWYQGHSRYSKSTGILTKQNKRNTCGIYLTVKPHRRLPTNIEKDNYK